MMQVGRGVLILNLSLSQVAKRVTEVRIKAVHVRWGYVMGKIFFFLIFDLLSAQQKKELIFNQHVAVGRRHLRRD